MPNSSCFHQKRSPYPQVLMVDISRTWLWGRSFWQGIPHMMLSKRKFKNTDCTTSVQGNHQNTFSGKDLEGLIYLLLWGTNYSFWGTRGFLKRTIPEHCLHGHVHGGWKKERSIRYRSRAQESGPIWYVSGAAAASRGQYGVVKLTKEARMLSLPPPEPCCRGIERGREVLILRLPTDHKL